MLGFQVSRDDTGIEDGSPGKSRLPGGRRTKTGNAVIAHPLILNDDEAIECGSLARTLFRHEPGRFGYEAVHSLAKLFRYFLILASDESFQPVGVMLDPALGFATSSR